MDLILWTLPGANAVVAIPGMVLWLIDSMALAMLLGGVCARFRDIPPIVASLMQIGFFMTPVIWPFSYIPTAYHLFGDVTVNLQAVYGFFNPLGPVINSVRQTMLLGMNPSWWPLTTAFIGSLCYITLGYKIFKRYEVNFADIA